MTSDPELTDRVAGGDAEAVAQLYNRFARLVYRIVSRIVHDPVRADDVLQATFLQVLQQAGRLDPARGSVASWLIAIARSRAIDHVRATRARARWLVETGNDEDVTERQGTPNAEDALLAAESSARLRRAVNVLPVPQRLAVELAFYRGLTHAEVAAALRQPLGTVKTRIRLAMERLRFCLTSGGEAQIPQAEPSPFTVALAEYLSANPVLSHTHSTAALNGVRVLVVDDDLETVELIRAVLESSGASVTSAGSAADALLRLRAAWPHVMLADLGMPTEDGYALLRQAQLMAGGTGRTLAAAAFTARADARDKVLAAGFALHLRKPIEPGSIIHAVATLTRPA